MVSELIRTCDFIELVTELIRTYYIKNYSEFVRTCKKLIRTF